MEVRPPLPPQPAQPTEVGQGHRGGDDHGGERRLGQVPQQPRGEDQQEQDGHGADQPGHLGLGAVLRGHRRAGAAGADREPLEEPRRDVRCAHADHLPVAVDLVPAAGGERRRRGDRVGQRHQRDAQRAGDQQPQVVEGDGGDGERRKPSGIGPTTVTPRSCRSSRVTGAIASTTATRTPGTEGARAGSPGSAPGSPRRPPGLPPPCRRRRGPARTRPPPRRRLSASTEKPKSLGSWPTTMVSASPFMYPICVGLDSSSATNPSLKSPGEHSDRAHHQRQQRGVRHRAAGVSLGHGQRDHGRRDHRAQRRVGTQHQDPGRPEDRVAEQAQDGRVQPGDGRQARELGVRHPLRDEQCCEDQAGYEVLAQPPAFVVPQARESRRDARDHRLGVRGGIGHGSHRLGRRCYGTAVLSGVAAVSGAGSGSGSGSSSG